jgi:AraC family transcriptional regulator
MDLLLQSNFNRRLESVEFLGAQMKLLGRVASTRGVQVLATHGMPNGRIENCLTADMTVLVYTPRMPADASASRRHEPFAPVGPFCFFKPGGSITLRGSGPFTSSYCVFSAGFLADLSETESGPRIGELRLKPPVESERLTYLGQAMLREAIAPGFGGALFAEAMGMAVALEIARLDGLRGADDEPRRGRLAPWQIRRLEAYIRDHLSDRLSLNDLAKLLEISVQRLSQAIKITHGVSLYRWIAERRIAEARRLLIETDLSVDEVGKRCAFRSAAAFSTAFRAVAGCAPSAFRRVTSS